MSEKDLICEALITIQISAILKNLYGNPDNFEIIPYLNSVKIIRKADLKELLIPYQNVKKKCITGFCSKWTAKLERIIESGFNDVQSVKTDSWIIKFKDGVDVKKMMSKMRLPSNIKMNHIYDSKVFNGINCVCGPDEIESLRSMFDGIEKIEPDLKVEIAVLKNRSVVQDVTTLSQTMDAYITRIGANRSSQRSGNGSGSLASRTNINVFIIDTGISRHIDLNIIGGRNFTTSNTADWVDRNGHGTHVAGIIGGRDNTVGIVGVAPSVRLWAVKVLGDDGSGSTSNIIAALNWILQNRNVLWFGKGIINMSLGGGINSPLDTAVNNIIKNGIVTVVAAGNSSINAANSSPARVANAITVAASSPKPTYNALASFSNFGSLVDIVAPGTTILSTYLNGQYAYLSGTSMASPVVAGTIALMLSTNAILGGNTLTFVNNVRNKLVTTSAATSPKYYDGGTGSNPRISVPSTKPTTNISVWSGMS